MHMLEQFSWEGLGKFLLAIVPLALLAGSVLLGPIGILADFLVEGVTAGTVLGGLEVGLGLAGLEEMELGVGLVGATTASLEATGETLNQLAALANEVPTPPPLPWTQEDPIGVSSVDWEDPAPFRGIGEDFKEPPNLGEEWNSHDVLKTMAERLELSVQDVVKALHLQEIFLQGPPPHLSTADLKMVLQALHRGIPPQEIYKLYFN